MDANTIRLVRLALGVITDRLLTLAALAMTFALACWAMREPDIMRECMAGFFALCVFLPSLFRERTKSNESQISEQDTAS